MITSLRLAEEFRRVDRTPSRLRANGRSLCFAPAFRESSLKGS